MGEKNITAIIMYWYPYVGATQPIYKAIFTHLLKNGYRINIIAGVPHFRKGRKEVWHEYKGVFYKKSLEEGLCVQRTFVLSPKISLRFDKNGILRRLINYTSFFVSALLTSIFARELSPKLLFVPTFPPLLGGLLGYLISFIKKTPFVYNVQDVHPDLLYSIKLFQAKPISFLLEKSERFVYSRAKHIIVISDTIKNTLHNKGVPLDKITVIPNFCDTDFIRPGSKDNEFSREHDITDKFVVMFAGNISEPQGVEFIIEAAKLLTDYKDILIAFVGRGEKKQEAEKLVRDSKLKNVFFIPLQPLRKMPLVWASADVALVSLRKNLSHLAFPSKIYGILSSGTPAIAMVDKNSEIWEFIEASGGGICVVSEDYKGLADKVSLLYKDHLLRKQMGERGRRFVEKKFSKEIVLHRYLKLFDELVI